MERIVIKNFGPIKDVDLEINDFMIFIGPQASGKSTIAKLIYFYKNLNYKIRDFLLDKITKIDLRKEKERLEKKLAEQCIESYFKDIFPESDIYKNAELKLYFEDDFSVFLFINNEGIISIILPQSFIDEFEETLQKGKAILNSVKREDIRSIAPFIIHEVEQFLVKYIESTKINRDNLYIPAGRGFISIISNQIFNLNTENLDYFIKEFASVVGFVLNDIRIENTNLQDHSLGLNGSFFSLIKILEDRKFNILKGKYLFDEEKGRPGIEIGNKEFIPLDKTSSGQQEAVWVLQYLTSRITNNSERSSFTIIEEPEAHLYPEAQKSITELIVLLINIIGNQGIITTHSPYILAAINNLLYANKVGRVHEKEVAERIDKNLWLDYNRVGAYFVGGEENEGRIKRIMDDELELIENQYIDSASQIINKEFDFIYALED